SPRRIAAGELRRSVQGVQRRAHSRVRARGPLPAVGQVEGQHRQGGARRRARSQASLLAAAQIRAGPVALRRAMSEPDWGKATEDLEERRFLSGPKPRTSELRSAWKIFRELLRGFRALHFVGPCVTVFGSARYGEDHAYYALAREVGRALSRSGFTVMT